MMGDLILIRAENLSIVSPAPVGVLQFATALLH
jgi:hypothetical protein